MCNCKRGLRGPQGEQGEQGPAGTFTISQATIGTTSVGSPTTVTAIASATSSGSIAYWGQFYISSNAAVQVTITPVIGGVDVTSDVMIFTCAAALGGRSRVVFPVGSVSTITSGQALAFKVELDDYTKTTSIVLGNILYNYQ